MTSLDGTADAVVIGAGLNGAATAFFLAQRGIGRITILDAGRLGDGASGDSAGLLRTHYDNRPETELAVRSMPYFRDWPDRIGGSCGWLQTGFFRFIGHDERWKLEANAAVQRELGDTVMVLDAEQVREIAPTFVVDDIGGAVYEPGSGTSDNDLATRSLLTSAAAKGARLIEQTPATGIITRSGRVIGVVTPRGTIASPIVILAAGAGSRAVAATCGVDIPCVARTINAAEIRTSDGFTAPGSYMDPITDSWIAPRGDGRIIVPASVNGVAGDSVAASSPVAALERVVRRVPGLANAVIVRTWTREDAFTPDGKPVIGAVDQIRGLFINTAGAGKGHKVAPAAGLALSELILDGAASTVDLAPFELDRFARPERAWSETEYSQRTIG